MTPATPDPETKQVDAICDDCGHVWTVAHLPMSVTDFVKLADAARCPNCASANAMVKAWKEPEQ